MSNQHFPVKGWADCICLDFGLLLLIQLVDAMKSLDVSDHMGQILKL